MDIIDDYLLIMLLLFAAPLQKDISIVTPIGHSSPLTDLVFFKFKKHIS